MRRLFSSKNRSLLAELVRTDFKIRYQGSALGYGWSLLRPLLLFLILYLVFAKFFNFGNDVPHYPVYLLLGIVLWNFFSEVTTRGLTAIVDRGSLLRKISISPWIIVISTSLSALINLALNLVIVAIFMVANHVDPMASLAWLPLILLEIYVLAFGWSLFLSAEFVKYRDVTYIWEVLMQAGFYLTPVIYALSRVQSHTFQKLIMLNPMAQAIQDSRYSVISHSSKIMTTNDVFGSGIYRLIPLGLVVIVMIGGIVFFARQAKSFAENV